MNIWLLQSSEPMPVVNEGQRLLRTGMMAEELNKRGYNVIWFSNTFDHFHKKQLYKKDTIVNVTDNYSIYLIHAMGYKRNISVSRIINHKVIAKKFSRIAKKLDKPDLIYASFPTIDYAEEAIKYGKKNNVPVIIDIRDLWPDIFKHNLSKPLALIASPYINIMNYKTKKIMRQAFAINSISEAMLEWGLKKGNREKSKYDQYFYIGYDSNNRNIVETKEMNSIDKDKFNLSFFATINNQFDYEKIIELAKLLEKDKDIVINICGDGPQFAELKEKVKDASNIKLLGWKEKEELNYILQNSKLGLAPYKNTFDFQMSVSNKFAEYISYGLPVILFSEGYMEKLLEDNECGIASQDTSKLCNFILDVKNDKQKYEAMSKNAQDLYQENFVAEKIYKNLVDYLERVKEEVKK